MYELTNGLMCRNCNGDILCTSFSQVQVYKLSIYPNNIWNVLQKNNSAKC